MYQHQSWSELARQVLSLMVWVTRRMLRLLLRRPVIDILALLVALWLLTSFLGKVFAPQPVLYQPAAVFEGR
jgi:hypothetical protein